MSKEKKDKQNWKEYWNRQAIHFDKLRDKLEKSNELDSCEKWIKFIKVMKICMRVFDLELEGTEFIKRMYEVFKLGGGFE